MFFFNLWALKNVMFLLRLNYIHFLCLRAVLIPKKASLPVAVPQTLSLIHPALLLHFH